MSNLSGTLPSVGKSTTPPWEISFSNYNFLFFLCLNSVFVFNNKVLPNFRSVTISWRASECANTGIPVIFYKIPAYRSNVSQISAEMSRRVLEYGKFGLFNTEITVIFFFKYRNSSQYRILGSPQFLLAVKQKGGGGLSLG